MCPNSEVWLVDLREGDRGLALCIKTISNKIRIVRTCVVHTLLINKFIIYYLFNHIFNYFPKVEIQTFVFFILHKEKQNQSLSNLSKVIMNLWIKTW